MRTIRIASNWFNAGWTLTVGSLLLFGLVLALLFALPAATHMSVPFLFLLLLGGVCFGAIGFGAGKLLVLSDSQAYGKLSGISLGRAKRFYDLVAWAQALTYLLAGLAITALLSQYLADTAPNTPSDILGAIGNTLLAQLPGGIGNPLRWAVLALLCYNFAQSWTMARFHKSRSPTNYVNKSKALLDSKRYAEALAATEHAIQSALASINKSVALNNLKRSEETLTACDRAIQLDRNDARAYNHRGLALSSLKRYPEALATYESAIQLDPNQAPPYNNKGWILYELQRYEEALAAVEHGIQLDPDQAHAHDTRGATLIGLQHYEEALIALDRAAQLDPQSGEVYHHKGLLFQKLGQTAEAEQAFQKAHDLGYEEETA